MGENRSLLVIRVFLGLRFYLVIWVSQNGFGYGGAESEVLRERLDGDGCMGHWVPFRVGDVDCRDAFPRLLIVSSSEEKKTVRELTES